MLIVLRVRTRLLLLNLAVEDDESEEKNTSQDEIRAITDVCVCVRVWKKN